MAELEKTNPVSETVEEPAEQTASEVEAAEEPIVVDAESAIEEQSSVVEEGAETDVAEETAEDVAEEAAEPTIAEEEQPVAEPEVKTDEPNEPEVVVVAEEEPTSTAAEESEQPTEETIDAEEPVCAPKPVVPTVQVNLSSDATGEYCVGFSDYKNSPYYLRYRELRAKMENTIYPPVQPTEQPKAKKKCNVASLFVALFGLLYLGMFAVSYFLDVSGTVRNLITFNGTNGIDATVRTVEYFTAWTHPADLMSFFAVFALTASGITAALALIGGLVAITRQRTGAAMAIGNILFFIFAAAAFVLSFLTDGVWTYGALIMIALGAASLISACCGMGHKE